MKKILFSVLAVAALFTAVSCEKNLDIPQKGVSAYETFYKTDEDAQSALTAAYAQFATYVTGRGNAFIYVPIRAALNNCADDMYAAGSNFGDNDYMGQLNEFRYDSGCEVIGNLYTGLFLANYACNLVIDNFKDGLPEGGPTATTKRCVAEARVMRAYIYFVLTALWNTPPFIEHVIADGLPYNSDNAENENLMSHEDLFKWVASECESAAADLDERTSPADKDGAVKVTKGFAWALEGKALLFAKDYSGAKNALEKVIKSGKYALVAGKDYWQNFHVEGDGNSEKVFESNIEYNSGIGAWGGINQRSTWMEANIWSWRSDHFSTPPHSIYNGGEDGWGGLGVPQWFADEFFKNDGHSYRFDTTFKAIDDAVYNMRDYGNFDLYEKHAIIYDKDNKVAAYDVDKPFLPYAKPKIVDGKQEEIDIPDPSEIFEKEPKKIKVKVFTVAYKDLPDDMKAIFPYIGISDIKDGLYGQSFWLPFKQMVRGTDAYAPDGKNKYGGNVRLNNNVVMRYAEVLLLYAEACLMSNDAATATTYINMIRTRAGIDPLAGTATMDDLKKEKSYELWNEGCRYLDILRWGDTARLVNAGQAVPKLFDKVSRKPKAGEKVTWQYGTEENSRFYTVDTHEAIDANWTVGFKDKHKFFPFPTSVMDKNPNLVQNPGWE